MAESGGGERLRLRLGVNYKALVFMSIILVTLYQYCHVCSVVHLSRMLSFFVISVAKDTLFGKT